MNIFIPSYFGAAGSSLRTFRKELHRSQLIWILQNTLFEKIYIASQGYQPDEYIQDERICYIDIEPKNPARARNVLLDKLDEIGGMGIFIDNDLTANASLDSIITAIQSSNEWDLLGLTYVGKKEKSEVVPDELTFKRLTSFATGAFAIRANLGVRFDEEMHDMEDKDFSINLMLRHRKKYYQLNNCTAWFYYDEGESTIYRSTSQRAEKYKVALEQIKHKYQAEFDELGAADQIEAVKKLPYEKTITINVNQRDHTQQYKGRQLF